MNLLFFFFFLYLLHYVYSELPQSVGAISERLRRLRRESLFDGLSFDRGS